MNRITLPQNKGNNLLFHSISHINIQDIISLLNDKEADINARNINGSTPLHFAVFSENPTLVSIILSYNPNPSPQENYDTGEKTPLHYAVEKDLFEICSKLLDFGANCNSKDKRGLTPLHYAARFGRKDIVNLLLASGADVNQRDENGFSASYWAEINKFTDILGLLPPPKSIPPEDLMEFTMQF